MLTLRELKKMVEPADERMRVPTVKALQESGVPIVVRELLNDQTEITVFANGYVIYRSGKRMTVFMLFLILHAFKHLTAGGFGIRQVLDILIYAEKYESVCNWEHLCEVLTGLKAELFLQDLYDFIYGPVANDDVYTTFNLYTAGALTKDQTLEALKIKKLYNQLVLTSEKALSYLKFVGTVPEEEF